MTSVSRSAAMAMPMAIGKRMDSLSLAQTPGGSIYGTTPGGTRVQYSLRDLIRLSQSPLSRTLPAKLPLIPGITVEDGESRSSSPASVQSPLSSSPGANDSGLGNAEVRITTPARSSLTMAGGDGHHQQNWPGFVIQRQRSSNSYSQGDLPPHSRILSGDQQVGGRSSSNAANKPASNNKQNIGRSHELPANWRDHPDMWAKPSPNKTAKKPASPVNGDGTAAVAGKDQTPGAAKKKRHHHKKRNSITADAGATGATGADASQASTPQQQRAQAAVAARGARRRRTVSETQVEERKKSDGAMESFAKKQTSQNVDQTSNANVVQQQRTSKAVPKQLQHRQQPSKTRLSGVGGRMLRTEDSVAEEADGEQFELDV